MAEKRLRFREVPRIVQAPAPTASMLPPPNRVISVILQPGEDVAWVWTWTPDGGSYVSGYTIVKRNYDLIGSFDAGLHE